MGRTNYTGSAPGFVVDPKAADRSDGRQIDWAAVPDTRIPSGLTKKVIPAGTIMAENSLGKIVPRKDVAAADTASTDWAGTEVAAGFLISTMQEDSRVQSLSGCGMFLGGIFYRELLPDHGEANFADWVTEITDQGSQVRLETYSDSRAA
jgi:hypothetical protein